MLQNQVWTVSTEEQEVKVVRAVTKMEFRDCSHQAIEGFIGNENQEKWSPILDESPNLLAVSSIDQQYQDSEFRAGNNFV